MAFQLDEAYLPATLTAPPMTDEEFSYFCAEHPDLYFEVTAGGDLIVMPPTYSTTSAQNSEINMQLAVWARLDGRGRTCESSGGFVLPNGARRSPDAAWTPKTAIQALGPEGRKRYWHLCPAFVIELRSQTHRLPVVREKMREWIDNGAELAWLIDPSTRTVEVYRPNREPEIHADCQAIAGEGPVAGFVLDLRLVWDPFAD